MNEVLPAPERAPEVPGTVRMRALARLKVLATLGAASVAASCSGGTQGANGDAGPFLGGDGGRDGGEDAYGVVDPLPPPACFRSAMPTVTAKYTATLGDGGTDASDDAGTLDAGGGTRLVEVTLSFAQSGVAIGAITSSDAKVEESSSTSTSVRFVLRVSPNAGSAGARVQVSCSTGPSALNVDLQLGADAVTGKVSEY